MWNKFKIKELKNYVYLYDMQDVCTSLAFIIDLMAKMSTKFIPNFLNFVTLALFLWECARKITEIKLELLTDVNMTLDYENRIREGIMRAICHYA